MTAPSVLCFLFCPVLVEGSAGLFVAGLCDVASIERRPSLLFHILKDGEILIKVTMILTQTQKRKFFLSLFYFVSE
jgi:hypothetical protein